MPSAILETVGIEHEFEPTTLAQHWQSPATAICLHPLRIYLGMLGQIGDIVICTAVARRVKGLFPTSSVTFAVSERYRGVGELMQGLPYIDRVFVTELYCEKLTPRLEPYWWRGLPVDLRGDDEVVAERRHDIVFATRPRHRCGNWWEFRHAVEEAAEMMGVPGPIDCRTEICIPNGVAAPPECIGKIVLHNDPSTDHRKAWAWESVQQLVNAVGPGECVLLGGPGPEVPGALDLRGKTTLGEAAAVLRDCRCFIGDDSGLTWIAGSLQVPTVGLYGREYIGRPAAVQPVNARAVYLEAARTCDIGASAVLDAMSRIYKMERCRLWT